MDPPVFDRVTYQRVREHLLAERATRVDRELWNCHGVPYLVLRNHLSTLQAGRPPPRSAKQRAASGDASAEAAASAQSKYTFEGVRHIFDESEAPISVVAFAKVRSDLLAIGNTDGHLWLLSLPPGGGEAIVHKAQKIHVLAITGLDWSFDNSQLLTCGADGALCMWDAADGSCIRSMTLLMPLFCCRFHPLNPALALVGTASGSVEVYSCSAGLQVGRYLLPVKFATKQRQQVTAVECSNHHAFVGDSGGMLHMYRCDMHQGQVPKFTWHSKLHASAAGSSPVIVVQHVPFCRVTETPVLLVACADSSLTLVKIVGTAQKARMEVYSRVVAPPAARNLFPAICPLSCIQDIPLVTLPGEDTNVYIADISARNVTKPSVVMTLKGHSSPVVVVGWAFDESLLATGDCDGCCIIWMRAA